MATKATSTSTSTSTKTDPAPADDGAAHLPARDYTGTPAYQAALPWVQRDFASYVLVGPVAFTDENLGTRLHAVDDLAQVYDWQPGGGVPAGVEVVKANSLVGAVQFDPALRKGESST